MAICLACMTEARDIEGARHERGMSRASRLGKLTPEHVMQEFALSSVSKRLIVNQPKWIIEIADTDFFLLCQKLIKVFWKYFTFQHTWIIKLSRLLFEMFIKRRSLTSLAVYHCTSSWKHYTKPTRRSKTTSACPSALYSAGQLTGNSWALDHSSG